MNRIFSINILSIAILYGASAVRADAPKEPLQLNDVAPNIGPVSYPPIDDSRQLIFYFDAQTACNDSQLLGCEFAGGMFYVTGGNNAGEPNQVYVCNPDGTLNFQFDQWSSPGWGWRDLVYDGTYIYGSDDYVIDAFDLDGNPVPEMNIDGPISPNRALAYDPVTDTFWTQSFAGPLYNFDRDGNVIWTGTSGVTSAYGAAWDDYLPPFEGPWLWIFDQTGVPQTTIHQYDPINHTLTGWSFTIPLILGCTDQIAGGLAMTNQFVPYAITFIGVTQGTPVDMIFAYLMYFSPQMNMPAAPENFVVEPDPAGALSADLSWTNPTETVGGNPLTAIDSIVVLVDDELDTVLFGDPGQAMAITVLLPPPPALHQFTVYCVNDYGDGTPVEQNAWIGLDVPAGVENLVGNCIGTSLEAELTWDNPTAGAHGGYFPVGSIDGYTINRYGANPATFTITGLATYFYDDHIPGQGWYGYGVIPYNSSGRGPEVISDSFHVGPIEFMEIPYDWVEINPDVPGSLPGTNTMITGDDQNYGPFDIGFEFPFRDGSTFTSIRVCSNGWASFTSTSSAFSNEPIPSSGEPNNLIAPYWDDLYPPGGGSIWYYSDVAEGRFIIEWYDIPHYPTGGNYKFEAILWDDGTIDYMYADLTPGTLLSCTVGIENAPGSDGIQCTYNGSGPLEPLPLMGMAYYPISLPPPEMTITLTPVSSPIQIPATGGEFEFYALIEILEATALSVDLWTEAIGPTSTVYSPLIGPTGVILEPGSTGRHKIQTVPGNAPTGIYTYVGNAGIYPDTIWATDSFPFEKLATGDGLWIGDWYSYGELFDGETATVLDAVPAEFMLNGTYPNPFNPNTTISFAVPEAAKVTISVYDVGGRLVTTLVNGWRAAGLHEVTFDGTGLSSGIYIVWMTTGSFNATGKMVLMK